ncbi:caM kinase-like vesicle-associated protein [Anguilla anguilla]|uniref:caM kinase-like vesicle-associated protein n=1 Tax=Anguilla anguilla TaxID=7936 RepID=UPI0015A9C853|nr:caM kinase-like vesicle-associated protein [Anguilla anguilla]
MPFGCLVPRDGGRSSNLPDITDKYEFGQILKAKEFCELCLARERQTGQVFICKKFLKKDGRKVRRAAKNEIMILRMVSHPNILQLIDTYETRKEYFIIQEIATGGDLFDWILDQGSYTERDAANVVRQVLEAVSYLHSLNIVHRNLKLENLMYYTENNQSKVVLRDFYLSTFENGSITEPCGTPEYLAPEVVTRHRYGRPVDCWAVGVIMYILLSGNPPFFDEAEEENTDLRNRVLFCRIAAGEFEFDSPYWDGISTAAKALVCRLMEVDQMLRVTAQEALGHEWITGQGASERNLKDVVCAQFARNFAKSKWRKALCVTTFMQRLRTPEPRSPGREGGEKGGHGEDKGAAAPGGSSDLSQQARDEKGRADGAEGEERSESGTNRPGPPVSPSVERNPPSAGNPPLPHTQENQERGGREKHCSEAQWILGRAGAEEAEQEQEEECSNAAETHSVDSSDYSSSSEVSCPGSSAVTTAPPADQHKAAQQQQEREDGDRGESIFGSRCQIPAGTAEELVQRGNESSEGGGRTVRDVGGVSHDLGQPGRKQEEVHYGWEESAGMGCASFPVVQEQTEAALSKGHRYTSRSPVGGNMPAMLEQRENRKEETPSASSSETTTTRPPPPSSPPPSPPTHQQTFSQEGKDGPVAVGRPRLPPRGSQSGREL